MWIRRGLVLTLLLAGLPAGAEVYRCEDPSGSIRFTSDPAACPSAKPHEFERELQRPSQPAAPAAQPRVPSPALGADLWDYFPPAGRRWEVVEEAPTDPSQDADLWNYGVRAVAARHYTRSFGSTSEACSLEIWGFETEQNAVNAEGALAGMGWSIDREGSLLILVRGVLLELGSGSRPGVSRDCQTLGEFARAAVARRSR